MSSSKVPKSILFFGILSFTFSLSHQKSYRAYNERCIPYDTSASCDSSQGLLCLDSGLKGYRCLCPSNKLHSQIYDHKRNYCVGKVFNACVLNGKTKSSALNESLCVENAECESNLFHIPVCVCKTGYTESEDGCVPTLKHGESCYDPSSTDDSTSSTTTARSSRDNEVHPNKGKRCDEKHGQICLEGKCQCRYPSEQYYDSKEEKCISYANGRCTHDDGHLYSCVPHARCNAPPFKLHGSVLHHSIGRLPPLPPFLGGLVQAAAATATSSSRDGDDTDEDTAIFMMPFKPRLPPPPPPPHHHGHPPNGHHHHTMLSREDPIEFDTRFDHFDFSRSIFFGPGKKKGVHSDGEEPKCQCLPGFSKTPDGFCKLGHGSKCNPEDDEICNPDQFLECMDAHDGSFSCQCRNQMNERYDSSRQECVAMIGRKCRPMGKYPKCENGSECIDGTCQCTNGTSLTPMENSCMKNYGQPCEPSQCNRYRGLTCHGKSKTCLCIDSFLRYEEKQEACVASKGSICGGMRFDAYVGCEDGTDCKTQEIGGKTMASRCI